MLPLSKMGRQNPIPARVQISTLQAGSRKVPIALILIISFQPVNDKHLAVRREISGTLALWEMAWLVREPAHGSFLKSL